MNRILAIILAGSLAAGCTNQKNQGKSIPAAKAGESILYLDQIPASVKHGSSAADSTARVQDFINKWIRKELIFQIAEENLSPDLKEEIESQIRETRSDLSIYQYQRQMMLEKMDTTISDAELENYYAENSEGFNLGYNIVKALFIKIPFETPNLGKIKTLARSGSQDDLQELESVCYQFAEKFDDFNEKWVPLDRISIELPTEIGNEEYFLRNTSFYQYTDSIDVYLLKIRDYKLRSTTAPFDYVKEDIKRIIWNTRRLEFIQELENGIYNKALEENKFTIYNN